MYIKNNGPLVVDTDFWDSSLARRGGLYLSWNAGTGRLLVPDLCMPSVPEMIGARHAIVSTGVMNGRNTVEVLFEDGTANPFSIHMDATQSDRSTLPTSSGRFLTIWGRQGMVASIPCMTRAVKKLPHLKPWAGVSAAPSPSPSPPRPR